jgi:phosphoserine phosphatase
MTIDSINDLPLLEAVGHPKVVNPDPVLEKIAADRGWTIINLPRI